ncbi:MAG: FitA-like ribbon-helix-helix domain-containing protein [Acidimicrobiales bacterium]
MKRMNLRDVPDDVYAALADAAKANRQSLSAYVVDRLTEAAEVSRIADYLAAYQPPTGTGMTLEDAAAAVREIREAS